jgi:hypothetical protein
MNRAIECWSVLVAQATRENAERFAPAEWDWLLKNLESFPDPRDPDPGPRLAQSLEAMQTERDPDIVRVIRRLSNLHYVAIWALLIALRFGRKHPLVRQWWTLEVREQNSS